MEPTERFTGRASDYARYRPGYPASVLDLLHHGIGIPIGAEIADIGAGTGIFTRILLEAGHPVAAVEPNAAMREVMTGELSGYPRFRAVDGTAEATTLPD